MCDNKLFDFIAKNINKCEVRLDRYILPSLEASTKQKVALSEKKTSKELLLEDQIKKLQSCIDSKPCGENRETKLKELERNLKKDYELVTEAKLADLKGKEIKLQPKEPQTYEEILEEQALLEVQKVVRKYLAFTEEQPVEKPKLSIWLFMPEAEVNNLLQIKCRKKIRQTIDNKLPQEVPKGISRLLIIEMLYSVVRFCQKSEFSTRQLGTLLPVFYLTHQYFLSSLNRSTREVYNFFKDIMLPHCFDCPPDSMKIFNYRESASVATYFCSIYLQNIPLIKILTLPNFGLDLNYEKLPDPFEGKDKGGKKGGKK